MNGRTRTDVTGQRMEAAPQWQLVMPVKRLTGAKTRLQGIEPEDRRRLALAFAADTAAAALGAPNVRRVLVVTDDDLVAATVSALGADVIGEGGANGLNAAILVGLAEARSCDPSGRLAVVTADLPAVTSGQITAALTAAGRYRLAVLADTNGTGTVLLTENQSVAAPSGGRMEPRFGPGSCWRHQEAGHVELAGDWSGLRQDVDTAADLADAAELGLGPRTAEAMTELLSLAGRPVHSSAR